MNAEWTLADCLKVADNDLQTAACEYLDCPNQKNERELRIAGRAHDELQKLAKKTQHKDHEQKS